MFPELLRSYASMSTCGLILLGGMHCGAYASLIQNDLDDSSLATITLVRTGAGKAPQFADLGLVETDEFRDLFGEIKLCDELVQKMAGGEEALFETKGQAGDDKTSDGDGDDVAKAKYSVSCACSSAQARHYR